MGDKIVGFIGSDGAVKIHREDCNNLRHLASRYPYRIIRSRWSGTISSQFAVSLKVIGRDDIGIVSTITSMINKNGDTALHGVSIQSNDGMFEGVLTLGVSSLESLDILIKKLLSLKGVKQVERL